MLYVKQHKNRLEFKKAVKEAKRVSCIQKKVNNGKLELIKNNKQIAKIKNIKI